MSAARPAPPVLWQPSADSVAAAAITAFARRAEPRAGRPLATYDELWRWSVEDLDGFWGAVWDLADPPGAVRGRNGVLAEATMPGARWFPGARLNYAAAALAHPAAARALVAQAKGRPPVTLTYGELAEAVGAAAAGLRRLGVGRGDRVAAYLPNGAEAVVALLAVASLGAVWSAAAPETGPAAALDRFGQIDPVVLLAVDGYRYGGRDFDRTEQAAAIAAGLPTLRAVVTVPHLRPRTRGRARPRGAGHASWSELCAEPAAPEFEPVAFDHPLWILYSSGTTGAPKPIVHGHGGMLLEHTKYLALQADVGPTDVVFWFTTTGWMMWNFVVGGLLVGATIVCYDGSPGPPRPRGPWAVAGELGVTVSGPAPRSSWPSAAPVPTRDRTTTSRRCAWSARPAPRCPPRASTGSTTASAPTSSWPRSAGGPTCARPSSAAVRRSRSGGARSSAGPSGRRSPSTTEPATRWSARWAS